MNEDKLHIDGDFGGNRLKPSNHSQLLDTRRVAKVSHIDNQLACNLRHGVALSNNRQRNIQHDRITIGF